MCWVSNGFAQLNAYGFDVLDSLQNDREKLVAVFIHTDWCKYCAMMENTTFKNAKVISLLNDNYYFIDLNAEDKKTITYAGHKFKYKPSGDNTGIHELAEQLATIDNQVAYPTLCFLNADNEIVFQYNKYMSAKDLSLVLTKLVNSR